MKNLLNVLKNTYKMRTFSEVARKLYNRPKAYFDIREEQKILEMCKNLAQEFDVWANELDSNLWEEALNFSDMHDAYANQLLSNINFDLGGGGHIAVLYFLVRYYRPEIIVETGVAAGHSSRAILSAIKTNKKGTLYSSDFPYMKIQNPEKYIGILVEEELKSNWNLYTKGDRKNLPLISSQCGEVGLFHYDSDKSYSGRVYAIKHLYKNIVEEAPIIFDDIQDNWHFFDFTKQLKVDPIILHFRGKFVGFFHKPNR